MTMLRRRSALAGLLLLTLCLRGAAQPLGIADEIRSFLEGIDAGDAPEIAGQVLQEPDGIARVYRAREHAAIWSPGAPLENQVADLLAAISESVGHGFTAERYHRGTLEQLLQAGDPSSWLALELLLTDAFLSQAHHRGQGAVFPPNLDAEWQVPPAEIDTDALLLDTAAHRRPVADVLARLWPVSEDYAQLLRRRAEIAASGELTAVQVPAGRPLKPGQTDARVVQLKERLMGPGDYSPLYDDDLRREVIAFQSAAGLEPDGIVGDHTLEVLNATRVSWIDRIDANLERWRWLPRDTPDTYLRVNIAAFTLRAIENGQPALAMNVIVGQPYRRTPVFTETIKYLVLNPYWNVPYKIAVEDKLPTLKANAAALGAQGFEARRNDAEIFVPVDQIDWAGVTRRNYDFLLRQKPGPLNALGRIKFMLPNPYSIYLHDTPSRQLFARQERSFSSGCVRLEQPLQLAEWLLAREHHDAAGRIEALLATGETRTLYLKQPMPTYIVYFTAFVGDDGEVAFRRDIYGRDRLLVEALRKP